MRIRPHRRARIARIEAIEGLEPLGNRGYRCSLLICGEHGRQNFPQLGIHVDDAARDFRVMILCESQTLPSSTRLSIWVAVNGSLA
jgi:hypothetical protein